VATDATSSIWTVPLDGGDAARLGAIERRLTTESVQPNVVRWTRDATALLHNGGAKVHRLSLDGSSSQVVTRFIDLTVPWFDVAADGRRVILARAVLSRDAGLLRTVR
jgi:hypothetical protein